MTDIGFQRPRNIECDYGTLTESYGCFSAQPFERGYGVTVGNALRRVLLSSITGSAITAVRIQGVLHEFSTIPGVVEDVSDIILNLKSIPFKLIDSEQKTITLKANGPAEVKASDIIHDSDLEILDENIHIASLDKDGKLDMEMIVKNNKGYIQAELNYDENLSVDFIPIDSSHSPIKKVNYEVSPARVGKRIDFEKLTLEIETTRAISPKDALGQAAKIMRDHLVIFLNIVDQPVELEPETSKEEIPYISKMGILSKSIDHLELSVRSNNCLRAAGIEKIYELVGKTEEELLKTKNFGRKSLVEIKAILEGLGLGLNIKLHPKLIEMVKGTDSEENSEE